MFDSIKPNGWSRHRAAQPMRSKLFVPGTRPDRFAKALASGADAISIDLEDSVLEARKGDARDATAHFLQSGTAASSATSFATLATIVVRVNAPGSPHFEDDVKAIAWPGLHVINVPKVESPRDIRELSDMLTALERSRKVAEPIGILANIESPRGLRHAAEIAAADARVIGLQLGLGDLFVPLGIDPHDAAAVHQVQFAVRLAAGEAGIAAYDGAFADVKDEAGFRRQAQQAFRLGFAGKTCIHPSQVNLANEVFRPREAEIASALRTLHAWQQARQHGDGVLLVDGTMIDAPYVARAEALISRARQLGLLPAHLFN
jgi:citrate lyase subunit beta/citryl-CoA lyase